MATNLSQQILKQVQMLSPSEQEELLAQLQRTVQQANAKNGRSILELDGLGKEIWASIDAQEYVHRERSSWNG